MPEANLETYDLSDKTPEQLEQRRREIVASYGPNALARIDNMTKDHLRELGRPHRRPPASDNPLGQRQEGEGSQRAKGPKQTADDLLAQI